MKTELVGFRAIGALGPGQGGVHLRSFPCGGRASLRSASLGRAYSILTGEPDAYASLDGPADASEARGLLAMVEGHLQGTVVPGSLQLCVLDAIGALSLGKAARAGLGTACFVALGLRPKPHRPWR